MDDFGEPQSFHLRGVPAQMASGHQGGRQSLSSDDPVILGATALKDFFHAADILLAYRLGESEDYPSVRQVSWFGFGRLWRGTGQGSLGSLERLNLPWLLRARGASPAWVHQIQDDKLRAYCLLRYALQEGVQRLSTRSSYACIDFLRRLDEWREPLITDLAQGTLCHGPAAVLDRRSGYRASWTLRKVAPRNENLLDLLPITEICCGEGAGVDVIRRRVESELGRSIRWYGTGLTVNGARVTLPLHSSWRGGVAWPFGVQMEFVHSVGGPFLGLHELKMGEAYRLYLSSRDRGWERFDSRRVVGVAGSYFETPILVDLGPSDDVLVIEGFALNSSHLAAALEAATSQTFVGFVAAFDYETSSVLIGFEGLGTAAMEQALGQALRALHVGFRRLCERIGRTCLRVVYLPRGTLARFHDSQPRRSGTFGEWEPVHFVDAAALIRMASAGE